MPNADLLTAVQQLAEIAARPKKPGDRALRAAVQAVVNGFEGADAATVRKAMKALASSVRASHGATAQVLHLTLGALVESGAPAELAWPAIAAGLPDALAGATRFGRAVVRAARTRVVSEALATAGSAVAAKQPRDAEAWEELPARCLAAVACLSRSRKLRDAARAARLRRACEALSTGVAEVAQLAQVLDTLEGEPFIVLHPDSGRGFRTVVRDVTMNAELLVLLADALCGDPRRGKLAGARPAARAVKALRNEGGSSADEAVRAPATFELLPWDALGPDGRFEHRHDAHDHGLDLSGAPAAIPAFGKTRVLLLRDPDHLHQIEIEPPPGMLSPTLEALEELDDAEAARWLTRIAAKSHPKGRPPTLARATSETKAAPKKTDAKKAAAKKAAAKKTAARKAAAKNAGNARAKPRAKASRAGRSGVRSRRQ